MRALASSLALRPNNLYPSEEEGDVANVQLGDEAQVEYLEYASLSEKAQALFDLDQEEVMQGEINAALDK